MEPMMTASIPKPSSNMASDREAESDAATTSLRVWMCVTGTCGSMAATACRRSAAACCVLTRAQEDIHHRLCVTGRHRQIDFVSITSGEASLMCVTHDANDNARLVCVPY